MKGCNNICDRNRDLCEFCQSHFDVSSEFYTAERLINHNWVRGYLVKDKQGKILGITNAKNDFMELAWIKESTLRKYKTHYPVVNEFGEIMS